MSLKQYIAEMSEPERRQLLVDNEAYEQEELEWAPLKAHVLKFLEQNPIPFDHHEALLRGGRHLMFPLFKNLALEAYRYYAGLYLKQIQAPL